MISQIRTNGGLNDRPTPLSVIYRLRLIILGKHIGISQQNVNTEEYSEEHDGKDDFLTAKMFRRAEIDPEIPRPEDECIEDRSASHREDHGIKLYKVDLYFMGLSINYVRVLQRFSLKNQKSTVFR